MSCSQLINSGNAAICPQGRQFVIDNLTEGFDVYTTHRMATVRRLSVPPQRRGFFIRGVAFGEAAQAIVCGSDHGSVYVFSTKPTGETQTLVHAEGMMLFLTLLLLNSSSSQAD